MKPKSIRHLRKMRKTFCELRHESDLAELLEVPRHKLRLWSIRPQYRLFAIPKKDGSKRYIEDPFPFLKQMQRRLNYYLQGVYYFVCTDAAYGFMLNAKRDPNPRHILSNAQKHLGCEWLFNVDIEDFFHQVDLEEVYKIFLAYPFEFEQELAMLLAELCCNQGRLPMGAPTSPVLSNFACMELDKELLELSQWAGWTFTRFADDMSFSSQAAFGEGGKEKIFSLLDEHNFHPNPNKIRMMGPRDTKSVTGLVLKAGEVCLPDSFEKQLFENIEKLNHIVEIQNRYGRQSDWVEKYEERVEGMLTFAAFVLGPNDPIVLKGEAQMEKALNPVDEFSAVSWLDFGYF